MTTSTQRGAQQSAPAGAAKPTQQSGESATRKPVATSGEDMVCTLCGLRACWTE